MIVHLPKNREMEWREGGDLFIDIQDDAPYTWFSVKELLINNKGFDPLPSQIQKAEKPILFVHATIAAIYKKLT